MDFLDARRALVRHADVHVGLAKPLALARAASTAASTLAELPLVLMASSTSPGEPSACTCLE
jgi:hypothetical protein